MPIAKKFNELMGMRERWQMYAVTREAFVILAGSLLGNNLLRRKLEIRCLSVPGTEGAGVDVESCRALLDKYFANKVIDEAIAIYIQENPKLEETKPKPKPYVNKERAWYECSIHGDNAGCHQEGTLCGHWVKIVPPNEGYCSCGEILLYASDTKAWYCSEGCCNE